MKSDVLVAVADDQRFRIAMNRQRREQLRLAARLDAEVKRLAGVDDLLDHLAELIDLDRKNAAIRRLITGFLDRRAERFVDRLHAMPQQILETQDHRKAEPVFAPGLVDHLDDIDRRRRILRGPNLDVAARVDREIAESPTVDVVERNGGGNIPRCCMARV